MYVPASELLIVVTLMFPVAESIDRKVGITKVMLLGIREYEISPQKAKLVFHPTRGY